MCIRPSQQKTQIEGDGCPQASIFGWENVLFLLRLPERYYKGEEKEKFVYLHSRRHVYHSFVIYQKIFDKQVRLE